VIKIKCASGCEPCECCGEAWCAEHRMHYFECPCIGPHNAEELGYEVVERGNELYAMRIRKNGSDRRATEGRITLP
jgi:hypothetical protein